MENASKAIIMAGSILLTLVIISLVAILFNQLSSNEQGTQESLTIEQLEKYNRQFELYNRSLYGSELLSLANLIADYESKQEDAKNKIEVNVDITNKIIGYGDIKNLSAKKYRIQDIKNYNDIIETKLTTLNKDSDDYLNIKSMLIQLRATPFECLQVKYNKYGRISYMEFKDRLN